MKLRKEKSLTSSILVFIKTNSFKDLNSQYNACQKVILDVPSNDSMEITKQALIALERIYKEGFSYKKAGDIVGDINYHLKSKSLTGKHVKHEPYEKEASIYVSKFICDRKTNWNISKSTDK